VLRIGNPAAGVASEQELIDALREHGFVDGRDIVLEARFAHGRTEGLVRLAAELAALWPAVIVAYGPQATQAALAASPDVPVVAMLGEFVALGFAATLARPGGRVTGVNFLGTPLNAKRLELLAEALPKGSAVLNLGDPGTRSLPLVEGHRSDGQHPGPGVAHGLCEHGAGDRRNLRPGAPAAGGRGQRARLAVPG
jgi:putative tryptophan/tyrosine transport system substrate-binding protein